MLLEDDEDFSSALASRLAKRNFNVTSSVSADDALLKLKEADYDVVVADIKLPGMDGMEFLAMVRGFDKDLPVILVTGYASMESAREAVKLNAADYLLKPLENLEELLNPVYRAVNSYRLLLENNRLTGELKNKIAELERSERKYRDLFELASDIIYTVDTKGVITSANKRIEEITKYDRKEIIGKLATGIVSSIKNGMDKIRLQRVLAEKSLDMLEVKMFTRDGEARLGEMGMRPIQEDGRVIGVQCIIRDITDRKKAEEMIRDSEAKLREQKATLEQKNSALKELLDQIELERKRVKEDMFVNMDKLVIPFLKKLRKKTSSVDAKYIDTVERHLENLIIPFGRKISDKKMGLSPREIEICDMIKYGFSSKEISEFLSIAPQTIERHRNNIRNKMGIVNKDVNLRTYLQTLA